MNYNTGKLKYILATSSNYTAICYLNFLPWTVEVIQPSSTKTDTKAHTNFMSSYLVQALSRRLKHTMTK